jgi:hypothetical protein
MKGFIGLFLLITICVMASAKGLAPPGIDLSKPIVTVALETDAQLSTVNDLQACDDAFVVAIEKTGRDALIYQMTNDVTPTPYCLNAVIYGSNIIPGISARDCLTCNKNSWPIPKLPERLLKIPNFNMEFSDNGLPPPYS